MKKELRNVRLLAKLLQTQSYNLRLLISFQVDIKLLKVLFTEIFGEFLRSGKERPTRNILGSFVHY